MAGKFKQVSVQSLECPVCLNIFSDPKILSCSHTYCKVCLERLVECHGDDSNLICPVCRAETQVPNQDITQLQTSLALKSLVDDVKNQHQCCTHCKSEEKPQAVVFCQDCGKYLCVTCHNKHSQWDDFNDHVVIAVNEITSGKVSVRRHRKCRKHPKEDEEWVCSDCRMFICFKCGVMEHKDQGHCVTEASVYESNHMKNVEDLKSKAEKRQNDIQKYIDFITEEKECVSNTTKQCIIDINKAYEESFQQFTRKKELLIDEVKGRNEKVEKELNRFKELAQQQITHMTTITDLVAKRTKIPLETNALTAHDTLCQELQDALRQEDPDYKQPQTLSKKGKCVTFEKKMKTDELNLGEIVDSVVKSVELSTKNSMNAMVPTSDYRMAVGCKDGGIEIFYADGKLHQTVLKDVKIREFDFLSDGRYVVRDMSNEIALYPAECDEKLDVRFETLNDEEDWGGLAVDSNDQIYVGYLKAKKIQVFSPAGGKAIREIPCNVYPPLQITCYKDFSIINYSKTLVIMDGDGNVKHQVTKSNVYPFATVTQEAIMVAWVNPDKGLVTIEEYTNELEHIKTLISNHKFEKLEHRNWYYIQEFRSGEIGFCNPDWLYIFY